MASIVLVHGWSFDHHVWDAVRARLAPGHEVFAPDFGFFSDPVPVPAPSDWIPLRITLAQPVIAVGHSLGSCWWLSQSTLPWQRLLLLNGFPRFTEAADYSPAVAPRVLARMRKNFALNPDEVLAEFRAFCGAPPPPPGADVARLGEGLDWLAQWDGRARLAERAADIWALAGANDPIVPAGMSRAALAQLPPGQLDFADSPGHMLPLAAPELCAEWIERVAAP